MRSEAFKKYVLKRSKHRANPYNLSRIKEIAYYCAEIPATWEDEYDLDLMGSSWRWEDIVLKAKDCIVPAEVIHSKLCKALFT